MSSTPFEENCTCEYCKNQWNLEIIKGIGKFVFYAAASEALVMACPLALAWVGFGRGGVQALSWGARIQSWIGNVKKASLFARLTSMGAKGALTPGIANGIRAVTQVVGHLFGSDVKVVVPETQEEWQNLINEAIQARLICNICFKRIDDKLKGLCESVCRHRRRS